MQYVSTKFEPVPVIEFRRDEIELLSSCCNSHDDATCRAAGEQGGFVAGIRKLFPSKDDDATVVIEVRLRQIQTLQQILKIAEHSKDSYIHARAAALSRELGEIYSAARKMTPPPRPKPKAFGAG
ncbi:MAG: hypothetical protein U0Q18_10850 [Bryobacteraceae bacterium]